MSVLRSTRPGLGSTSIALFALAALVSASACNKTKKTTPKDCDDWALHLAEIMQNEADLRAKTCKDGLTLALQLGALAIGDPEGLAAFSASCKKSSADYQTKDEKCFLTAKTVKEAQQCSFDPQFKDAKGDYKAMLARADEDLSKKCMMSLDDLPPPEKFEEPEKKKEAANPDEKKDDGTHKKKKTESGEDDEEAASPDAGTGTKTK